MNANPAGGPCPHFGRCGGCLLQDLPYPEQLQRKQAGLRQLFAAHWPADLPLVAAPDPWYYRNKVELRFDREFFDQPPPPDTPRATVLGFRRRGRWFWTLDLQACHIFSPLLPPLLTAVRAWYRRERLPHWDTGTQSGLLRYLALRRARRPEQLMVTLVTAPGAFDPTAFVAAVRAAVPVTSIYHGVSHGVSDNVTADELRHLWGAAFLEEELHIPDPGGAPRPVRLRLSPFGFAQVNPAAAELLYGAIRAHVVAAAPARLYDLYGGAGGIALACADRVAAVVSVESAAAAAADGAVNARLTGAANIQFVTAAVEDWLADPAAAFAPDSLAVLDPPRAGLHPRALAHLAAHGPPQLVYVCCKPETLAKELPWWSASYRLTDLQAFDLFPHTPHVEVVARFARATRQP